MACSVTTQPQPATGETEVSALRFEDLPTGAVHHIFGFLGPRDLCVASAVCKGWRDLNQDAAANQLWRRLYVKRWRAPQQESSLGWQAQYSCKMRSAHSFGGKGIADILYGHTGAVQSVCLLPGCNLLATGSYDDTVRLWDLRAGLPLQASRPLRGGARCIAMDERLLVYGNLLGTVRLWRARRSAAATRFDLNAPIRLNGHSGPISTVALDSRCVYSGSWDCTVRVWNRETLQREALLAFNDWVYAAKPRGDNLLVSCPTGNHASATESMVAAGQVLHVHSRATGQAVCKHLHAAPGGTPECRLEGASTAPLRIDGTRDGRLVFIGGADGSVVALDLRAPRQAAATLWSQPHRISDLRFEDPWLAAGASNGIVRVIDVSATLRAGRGGAPPGKQPTAKGQPRVFAAKGTLSSVDIADNWLACGSADPGVRTWSFQHPEAAGTRSQTSGGRPRGSRRQRNRFPFAQGEDGGCLEGEEAPQLPTEPLLTAQAPLNCRVDVCERKDSAPSVAPADSRHSSGDETLRSIDLDGASLPAILQRGRRKRSGDCGSLAMAVDHPPQQWQGSGEGVRLAENGIRVRG